MKKVILYISISAIVLSACNNAPKSDSETGNKTDQTAATTEAATATSNSPISGLVNGYLQLSDALAQDNDKNAAEAGKSIVEAMNRIDKSSFTSEQTELYSEIEEGFKEHAEHISKNVGNIKHQREHFDMLSKDLYDLVKSVGSGQTLYVANCPMYNKNKGANWLSASKEIKNPYMGTAMLKCGTIKQELQ